MSELSQPIPSTYTHMIPEENHAQLLFQSLLTLTNLLSKAQATSTCKLSTTCTLKVTSKLLFQQICLWIQKDIILSTQCLCRTDLTLLLLLLGTPLTSL